jgi:deoxycytidine triphosphate deaminase
MIDQESRREAEIKRLKALRAKRLPFDDFPGNGVVLSDGIEFYCKQFDLISPFNPSQLKPANYKLTVGDEYVIGGEIKSLADEPGQNKIVIPSFEVVIIKTWETLNIARFLIARWNIRVALAYKGLLWVGGPQVDAGYVGHLFCPIYNLSDKEVVLSLWEPIAVIDFVKTTKFTEGVSKDYEPAIPERILIEDYEPEALKSALATTVNRDLRQFADRLVQIEARAATQVQRLEERTHQFTATILTILAVLFAVLAVFVSSSANRSMSALTYASFSISVLAILIALGVGRNVFFK